MSDQTRVFQLNSKEQQQLRTRLQEAGCTFSQPAHTVFLAKKEGLSCALYRSGKCVFQGKEAAAFCGEKEEQSPMEGDFVTHIGSDEAGKGDVFGPLCVAAVHMEKKAPFVVRDSKTVGDREVLLIAEKIEKTFPCELCVLLPSQYNELYAQFSNLNRLLAWAHAQVLSKLAKRTGCRAVLVDQFGPAHRLETALSGSSLCITQRPRAEEDEAVAAASLLARAAFLKGLSKLSSHYAFALPKGASSQVIGKGRQFVAQHGEAALSFVAKLHFKTIGSILDGI